MATEDAKAANYTRMMELMVGGLTMGIWEMVGESSNTLSPGIGQQILGMVEKQFGMEIAGEKPEDLMTELGRIFIDEMGFAKDVKVERKDNFINVVMTDSLGARGTAMASQMGMSPFYHPYLCAGLACLKRAGLKVRADVKSDLPNNLLTVVFELI
jgi:hypothetical protein